MPCLTVSLQTGQQYFVVLSCALQSEQTHLCAQGRKTIFDATDKQMTQSPASNIRIVERSGGGFKIAFASSAVMVTIFLRLIV